MYFGAYEGFARFEAVQFESRDELETWLNFQEPFSLAFGPSRTKRHELRDNRLIKRFLENKEVVRTVDPDGFRLYLYRPRGELPRGYTEAVSKHFND